MSTHAATTLAFVRTSAGVVKVLAGEGVPTDALPGEVTRLLEFGALLEVDSGSEGSSPPADPDAGQEQSADDGVGEGAGEEAGEGTDAAGDEDVETGEEISTEPPPAPDARPAPRRRKTAAGS